MSGPFGRGILYDSLLSTPFLFFRALPLCRKNLSAAGFAAVGCHGTFEEQERRSWIFLVLVLRAGLARDGRARGSAVAPPDAGAPCIAMPLPMNDGGKFVNLHLAVSSMAVRSESLSDSQTCPRVVEDRVAARVECLRTRCQCSMADRASNRFSPPPRCFPSIPPLNASRAHQVCLLDIRCLTWWLDNDLGEQMDAQTARGPRGGGLRSLLR